MAGPLSSSRPSAGAHLTGGENNWDEVKKDAIGVYRGKSLTRSEAKGGKVGVSVPSPSSMGQPPSGISNLHGKSVFRKRLRK